MLTALFSNIPSRDKRALDFVAGDLLFRQGERTRGLYLVERGAVQLVRNGPAGEKVVLHRSQSGECFAEASVFADRYHCDAIAAEASRVILIGRQAILAAFADPEFSRSFNQHLARQLQQQRHILEIVAIRSAEDRVFAGLLAGLLKGTVIDFAATLHLSHEATYRALRSLTGKGVVRRPGRGRYEIAVR